MFLSNVGIKQMVDGLTAHEGFSRYISTPPKVLLIYQLKPKGAVNNWLLARLRMRFNVLLCQRHVYL